MMSLFGPAHGRISRFSYARELGEWADNLVREYFGLGLDGSFTEDMRRCTFFVTITFDPEQMMPLKASNGHLHPPNPTYEWDQVTHFYNLLLKYLRRAGASLDRPPMMIAGLDFDRSRNPRARADEPAGLHIHALLIFDVTHAHLARQVLDRLAFLYCRKFATLVDALDVRPFDFSRYTLAETFSYASKGEAIIQDAMDWGLAIRMYDGRHSYRQERKYQPLTASQRQRRRLMRQVKKLEAEDRAYRQRYRTTNQG